MSIFEILPSDVQFSDSSFMDLNDKAFYWNDRLFRGIYPRRVSFYRDFLKSPAYLSLHESGRIVETSIADLALRDFGAVLEHKKIAQISYCFEWPPEMLKDAALATLEICDRLLLDGKTLQDATPWNILFNRLNPVLIDFTSVSEINPQILWAPYQQFCNFFYHPLLLYSFGRRSLAGFFLTTAMAFHQPKCGSPSRAQINFVRRDIGAGWLFRSLFQSYSIRTRAKIDSETSQGRRLCPS